MKLVRRQFLNFAGAALALPVTSQSIFAQVPQAGPKLTQILKSDLQGQGQKVEETAVNILEVAPGAGAPWHMHPAAQEIIFVVDGNLTVEVDGQGTKVMKAGEITLIPAEVPHLVRNESGGAMVKASRDLQSSRQGETASGRRKKGDVSKRARLPTNDQRMCADLG